MSASSANAQQTALTRQTTDPIDDDSDDDSAAATAARGPSADRTHESLLALLTADAAKDAKPAADAAKIDPNASSSNSPSGGDPGNAAALTGPNAAVAHLSVASHFGAQRSETDNTTYNGDLQSPVGTAAWNDELGTRVTWMAHQGLESASLHLSPEHLGPMEVRISVQDGNASVWFGATQAETRTALEQALPHLRDLFASQGLNLSNAGVFQQAPRDPPRSTRSSAVTPLSAVAAADSPAATTRLRLGLVDTYA